MKDLLAKLLGMFRQPEPTKPVETFSVKAEETKKPGKKSVPAKPKRVAAKGVVAAAKKTAAKKKVK